jgi:putative ABC transport system permease protein
VANSLVKKVWSDLTERRGRSLLTVLGLCVGFWGVGSAAVAWLVLSRDLPANFLQTNPPAIRMTVSGPDTVDVASLGRVEGALAIENRPHLTGRIQYGADRWMPLNLWVVEDFNAMRVARIFPEDATLPPRSGAVVVERDGLPFANILRMRAQSGAPGHGRVVKDGDPAAASLQDSPVRLRLSGGTDVETEIDGTVFDPARAPSRMEMTMYAYATRETVSGWGAKIADRLLVTPAPGHEDPLAIRETAQRLEKRLKSLGYEVGRTEFPSHTEHVHQFQMNSILWLISGVGTLALLMSMVLVVNLVTSILTNQIRQIGILKAMGASRRQIAAMYAAAMALLGFVAAVISLPLAVKSGFMLAEALSAFLNFELITESLPAGAYLGSIGFASLFPISASLPTLQRWSSVAVSDALRHFGANPDRERAPRLERLMAVFPMNVRLGLRNAFRRPQRTALTAATLGLGVTVFMVAMNTRASLLNTAEIEERSRRYDVIIGFDEPVEARRVAFMEQFPIVARAETWNVESARITGPAEDRSDPFRLFRVPDDSDMLAPYVLAGSWLNPQSAPGVVINHRLQQSFPELQPGSVLRLEVDGQLLELKVLGVIKEFGPASLYMRDPVFRQHVNDREEGVNAGFVRLKQPTEQNLSTLTGLLESHFDLAQVPVRGLQSGKTASRIIRGHLDVIVAALVALALIILAVSTLGMMSAVSAGVVERSRELAILRSLGGQPASVRRILSSESTLIAVAGWAAALVLASIVSAPLASYFGEILVEYPFDFEFSSAGIIASLGIAVAVARLASILPARFANRRSVGEAIQGSEG